MKCNFNFLNDFLDSLKRNPDKAAVSDLDFTLSYSELWSRAIQVQEFLKSLNRSEELIGITGKPSVYNYAFILGTWMHGAGYVFLNTENPAARNEEIIQDSKIKTILSNDLCGEIFQEVVMSNDFELPVSSVEQDIAYAVYTSGTTGKPKGVPISKHNLNAFTSHYLNKESYQFNEQDKFLQSYELSFDVSVFCFTIPLMLGAELMLPANRGVKYLGILSCILKEGITVCSNVPSVAKYCAPRLNEVEMSSLRYCFFSGDALYGDWAKAWMKSASNAIVFNCYGPTETTIVCTTENLNVLNESYFEKQTPLPLGVPFDGMKLELSKGEIVFEGDQVFKGYLNNRTTSLESYKTGDLAYLDTNGKLIFTGRSDSQIQVNGYRVELSEIDVFMRSKFNLSSVSLGININAQETTIVTVVEGSSISNVTLLDVQIPKWKEELLRNLPSYFCPKYFVPMSSFPMNINGKLDRNELVKIVEGKINC